MPTKEEIAAYNKRYHEANREKLAVRSKYYRERNKDAIAAKNAEYRQQNKARVAELSKLSRQRNREAILAGKKKYRTEQKEKVATSRREHYLRNSEAINLAVSQRRLELRLLVLKTYSPDGIIRCINKDCPEHHNPHVEFLQIDHIENDGNEHRKIIGHAAHQLWHWLKKNGFPPGFQILCANCNMHKSIQFMRRDTKHSRDLKFLKSAVFAAYSPDGTPRCSCPGCPLHVGEPDIDLLALDHIDCSAITPEDRVKHRGSTPLYRHLRRSGYPAGYQVLCHNCNGFKRQLATYTCPHL